MNVQQELIEIVASAAKQLGIDIMLIGAFARDYWSGKFSLKGNTRTTYDVEFLPLLQYRGADDVPYRTGTELPRFTPEQSQLQSGGSRAGNHGMILNLPECL